MLGLAVQRILLRQVQLALFCRLPCKQRPCQSPCDLRRRSLAPAERLSQVQRTMRVSIDSQLAATLSHMLRRCSLKTLAVGCRSISAPRPSLPKRAHAQADLLELATRRALRHR